jgi:hypothetical protein
MDPIETTDPILEENSLGVITTTYLMEYLCHFNSTRAWLPGVASNDSSAINPPFEPFWTGENKGLKSPGIQKIKRELDTLYERLESYRDFRDPYARDLWYDFDNISFDTEEANKLKKTFLTCALRLTLQRPADLLERFGEELYENIMKRLKSLDDDDTLDEYNLATEYYDIHTSFYQKKFELKEVQFNLSLYIEKFTGRHGNLRKRKAYHFYYSLALNDNMYLAATTYDTKLKEKAFEKLVSASKSTKNILLVLNGLYAYLKASSSFYADREYNYEYNCEEEKDLVYKEDLKAFEGTVKGMAKNEAQILEFAIHLTRLTLLLRFSGDCEAKEEIKLAEKNGLYSFLLEDNHHVKEFYLSFLKDVQYYITQITPEAADWLLHVLKN